METSRAARSTPDWPPEITFFRIALESLIKRAYGAFADQFGHSLASRAGSGVAVAPGRINIIGEHTDYNDGFVLPMAIDRHIAVAFEANVSGTIQIWSEHVGEVASIDVGALKRSDIPNWVLYASGMIWAVIDSGIPVTGTRLAICSDLPVGAGVSSSAAFEVGLGMALSSAMEAGLKPIDIARLAHKSDHEFVGIPSGIMDQFASACCRRDHALLLDCRDESFEQVPLSGDGAFVVIDTGRRRELVEGAYAERVRSCREAVEVLRRHGSDAESLRSVTLEELECVKKALDPTTFKRARHVVTEMDRPLRLSEALADEDLEEAGRLMNESHRSLAVDYEVSCEELDAAVEIAREHPGCFGARLTGAGFGGCAIALCHKSVVGEVVEHVDQRYQKLFGMGDVYSVEASSGVRVVSSTNF
jgi:galactokinase